MAHGNARYQRLKDYVNVERLASGESKSDDKPFFKFRRVYSMLRLIHASVFFFLFGTAFPLFCSPFSLAIFVDAPHLNYADFSSLLASLENRKRNHPHKSVFGHAWIALYRENQCIVEGGFSGERGILQPQYLAGIINLANWGNVEGIARENGESDLNPIRYLWEDQRDGFFQEGRGEHVPTYGAFIPLSEEQLNAILSFISPNHYPYSIYSLTDHQCVDFVVQVAQLVDWHLPHRQTFFIPKEITTLEGTLTLWTDPFYKKCVISSPDRLEKSLKESVLLGFARAITEKK